ncbi:MAG: RNA polymerase sigma factor [Sideroxyarcus sp.]|nr:RNA polymerase sigma factor [Sideroxyarcus sp.]
MSTSIQLSDFLASVERRAFKHASYAVRDEQAALDIVQEAMIKLVESYGDKPPAEFPLLFQRILQNTIRDHFRRQKVRNAHFSLFSSFTSAQSEDEVEVLDILQDEENASQPAPPHTAAAGRQLLAIIEAALRQLPARQREAFLLRYWEGLDTAGTAVAMGCSEGSVKTHCSRATTTLAHILKQNGVDLTWASN